MYRMLAPILAVVLATGCTARVTVPKATLGTGTTSGLGNPSSGRSIDFAVRTLSSMADSSGKIVNADPAGIVAAGGGNIVASGAGNVVAQGGGNLVAQGGGNFAPRFQLATAQSGFTVVAQAVVHVENLDGTKLSNSYVTSTNDGHVTLIGMPDTRPVLAVAQWKENGKIYRTSTVVATGTPGAQLEMDPINHFVQGRVRTLLQAGGKLDAISGPDLANVWSAFNEANIALTEDVLRDDATLDDLNKFYAAKVGLLPADKQCLVKQYMAKLGASAPSTSACPAATATP